MRRIILFLSVTALAVSCSKKQDDKAPAETPPADRGTPGEVADDTPPEAKPDKPPSPPAVAAGAVDCDALFTAADVAKACGGKVADFEVRKRSIENGKGLSTCFREAVRGGDDLDSVRLTVNSRPRSPEEAQQLLAEFNSIEGAKTVKMGDGAYRRLETLPGAVQHYVEVVKGKLFFSLFFVVAIEDTKPPICTDDGLVELGKVVAGRLP
jgi:hypothetical protein